MEKISPDTLEKLSDEAVQQFIRSHSHEDVAGFLLKNKSVHGVSPALIADQLVGRNKAKEKLPLYFTTPRIIYPAAVHIEQSSSEAAAGFKAGIVQQLFPDNQATGADLTSGFGVDAFFLSRVFRAVHAVEPDKSLMAMARHNHAVLGAQNISWHETDAASFIAGLKDSPDLVYIDPSRRTSHNRKVHALEDSEPDVVTLQKKIFEKANVLMVKASPLLDIQAALKSLDFVRTVHVVSVYGECKEVLFVCKKGFVGVPAIETVNITGGGDQVFGFSFPAEQEMKIAFSDPRKYLYEPNASILKAGAFKSVAARFSLEKIQVNTHLYTSDQLVADFPGRSFEVEASVRPDASAVKAHFPGGKGNVTTRNYPLTADALKKKTGLKDGGEKFLFGFSGQRKKFLVVARRIS